MDTAVLVGSAFDTRKDLLAQILDINLAVAAPIENGQFVTGADVPPTYAEPEHFATDDCIRLGARV